MRTSEDRLKELNNPAKSAPKMSGKRRKKKSDEKTFAKKFGIFLTLVQGIFSGVFLWALFKFELLPIEFMAIVALGVVIFFLITFKTQKKHKGRAIGGKIFSILIIIILSIGSCGLIIVNSMFGKIIDEQENNISVTSQAYNLYVHVDDENLVATNNPKTKQILFISTPSDYYITIPGVSSGQKDKLSQAGTYGVEASVAALENVYSTDIPLYVRIDFESLNEIAKEFGSMSVQQIMTQETFVKVYDIFNTVNEYVETNLTQKQIQELLKIQWKKEGSWSIYSTSVTGTNDNQFTYSSQDVSVYVMIPDQESVSNAKDLMYRVKDGEKIKGSKVLE